MEANNHTYAEDDIKDDDEDEHAAIEKMYCCICETKISNILFLSCRQVVVCTKCYPTKMEVTNQCPDCKSLVEKTIEIVPRLKN